MEKYYNIHNTIKFKLVNTGSSKYQFNKVCSKYKSFESENSKEYDFIVYLGKFDPANSDCQIINNIYYIKKDYLYCSEDSYKFTKWKFEISGFENENTIVRVSGNFLSSMAISGHLIDILMRIKMNQKGYPFIHGSCINKNSRGILFPSRSGAGKTTIALHFVEEGWDFLSDDYTIIHDKKAVGFLSQLNIFTYNLSPLIKKNIGVKSNIILGLKNLLYKMTFGYIKIFTTLYPMEVFPNSIINECMLSAVFLLIPKDEFKVNRISRDELICHLVVSQKLESLPFTKHLVEYSYIFPDSKFANHWKMYKENLKNHLPENIPFYKVEVPQKYDTKTFEKILAIINETNT
ncbi:MAG: hypothetical protein ABOK23_07365 [Candidatus Methanoperedens sp.]|nr:hypothetical protein [Candidatus Methanoperedens sp.]MCZ7396178.1 hypothetical protein [Candidatus Methanoperedens sp.]